MFNFFNKDHGSLVAFAIALLSIEPLMAMELTDNDNETVMRYAFDAQIEKVMAYCNKSSFSTALADKSCLVALLNNSAINAYLCRPFSMVQLNKEGRLVCGSKYEEELYASMSLYFSYRTTNKGVNCEGFSRCGTTRDVSRELAKDILPLPTSGITIGGVYDIYEMREAVNDLIHNKKSWRYILFPQSKDGHACFLLAMAKKSSHEPLATFFVNSWKEQAYYDYMEYCFNKEGYYRNSTHKQKCSEQRHINCDDYYDSTTIPFIDASFHIQIEDHDANCALYTLAFVRAAMNFLQSDMAESFIDQCEAQQFESAATLLIEGMKPYLKEYYQQIDGGPYVLKDQNEIKQYHLGLRWKIGNDTIKNALVKLCHSLTIEQKRQLVSLQIISSVMDQQSLNF